MPGPCWSTLAQPPSWPIPAGGHQFDTIGGHVRKLRARVVPDGADILLGLGARVQVSPKFAINRHLDAGF
jgi:hypothetical protein